MDWIKVTPETMPLIKSGSNLSKELWLTVLDKTIEKKKVVMSHYGLAILKRDPVKELCGYNEDDKVGVFLPEYDFVKKDEWDLYGAPVRKENIKVTHWAEVKYPAPAED